MDSLKALVVHRAVRLLTAVIGSHVNDKLNDGKTALEWAQANRVQSAGQQQQALDECIAVLKAAGYGKPPSLDEVELAGILPRQSFVHQVASKDRSETRGK